LNYITLIGSQVPIIVLIVYLIGNYLIYILNSIYDPKYLPFITYPILVAIISCWLAYRSKREISIDIL
jgi:hypothetical protein